MSALANPPVADFDRETEFEPAYRIRTAPNDRARAMLLLQLPDCIVADHCAKLRQACTAARFQAGEQFLFVRLAALCATRLPGGLLPDREANSLEQWRSHFAAFARGS